MIFEIQQIDAKRSYPEIYSGVTSFCKQEQRFSSRRHGGQFSEAMGWFKVSERLL